MVSVMVSVRVRTSVSVRVSVRGLARPPANPQVQDDLDQAHSYLQQAIRVRVRVMPSSQLAATGN